MSGPVTKHQQLATTGEFNMSHNGHSHMHEHSESHGHKEVHKHHPKEHHGGHEHDDATHGSRGEKSTGHTGSGVIHTRGDNEVSRSSTYTDDIGTDGGHDRHHKHGFHTEKGGSTGSTRNRI